MSSGTDRSDGVGMRRGVIRWWEPYWGSVGRVRREFAGAGFLKVGFWVRVYAISGVVAAVFLYAIWRANPAFVVPWRVLAVPFAWPLIMLLHLGLYAAMP